MSEVSPINIEVPETIEGPRILLRRVAADDAPAITEAVLESLDTLRPWMPWAHSATIPEDIRGWVARAQAAWPLRDSLEMLIVERATGRLLGNAGLPRLSWRVRSFEIGYWLRTSAEGHGYMREAVQLLTRVAFQRLGANRVEIRIDPSNERSLNVAKRLGFVFEGTLRNIGLDAHGRLLDRSVFSLTPEDYRLLDWRI